MQVASILFATALTLITCLSLGLTLLKAARVRLYRSEEIFFGFVLGGACLSTIVLLLSVSGLAYRWVFIAVVCASGLIAYVSGAWRLSNERLAAPPRRWAALFGAVYTIFAVLYFFAALQPEASSDGAMYHVALPALYFRLHRIPPITTNFLASLSEGAEMLFLFAFSFGRHSAAAMVSLLFLLMLPFGILSYSRRIGCPIAGVVAGLLVFLSPVAALCGTTAYVDVEVSTVVFAVFYLLQIWLVSQETRLLIPAGLLAGFGYAIKYTAGLAIPYALLILASRLWRLRKPVWTPCLTLGLCAAAVMAPWMIKNAVVVGNPVSPLANRIFKNPYVYVSTEKVYTQNMRSLQGMSPLRVPYEVTTRGERTQGFLGPMFLLTPLALLALTTPVGRTLLFAAFVFLIPFPSAVAARYLLPAIPFIALALGVVLARWRPAAVAVMVLQAILSWPAVVPKYASRGSPRFKFPDVRAALRLTPDFDFLTRTLPDYGVDQLIEAKVPARDRIFSLRGFPQSYHSRELLVEWQSALGVRLGEALRAPFDARLQATRRFEFRFAATELKTIRLLNAESVSELRVYRDGVELPRSAEWKLRASPNPWDVPLAFDNSPLTRWSSRDPDKTGFIEVSLGAPTVIDEVVAECTPDQPSSLTIDRASRQSVLTVAPPLRLRRAAVEELERHDIHWLVINDLDPGARDFQLRAVQWGITLAGTSGRTRLYHLD